MAWRNAEKTILDKMINKSSKYNDPKAKEIFEKFLIDRVPTYAGTDMHANLRNIWEKSGSPYLKFEEGNFSPYFKTADNFESEVDTLGIPTGYSGHHPSWGDVIAELGHAYQYNHPELQQANRTFMEGEEVFPVDPKGRAQWQTENAQALLPKIWGNPPKINKAYADSLSMSSYSQKKKYPRKEYDWSDTGSEGTSGAYGVEGTVEHQAHSVIEKFLLDKFWGVK